MDDVFNDDVLAPDTQTAEKPPANQEQVAESKVEAAEQSAAGAPTAQEDGKNVPLAALEAERKGRQDWKEKAIRFEEELKALKNQSQQNQPQQAMSMEQRLLNERFNMSEMVVREKHADLDEMVNLFSDAAKKNPALGAQLAMERHPWEFAYREGKRLKMLAEMGDDPDAYRKKMREEIEAELRATLQPAAETPQAPHIPQSLASARSAATRGSATWTGPAPIASMFDN